MVVPLIPAVEFLALGDGNPPMAASVALRPRTTPGTGAVVPPPTGNRASGSGRDPTLFIINPLLATVTVRFNPGCWRSLADARLAWV
jgi:hypothetical protein